MSAYGSAGGVGSVGVVALPGDWSACPVAVLSAVEPGVFAGSEVAEVAGSWVVPPQFARISDVAIARIGVCVCIVLSVLG